MSAAVSHRQRTSRRRSRARRTAYTQASSIGRHRAARCHPTRPLALSTNRVCAPHTLLGAGDGLAETGATPRSPGPPRTRPHGGGPRLGENAGAGPGESCGGAKPRPIRWRAGCDAVRGMSRGRGEPGAARRNARPRGVPGSTTTSLAPETVEALHRCAGAATCEAAVRRGRRPAVPNPSHSVARCPAWPALPERRALALPQPRSLAVACRRALPRMRTHRRAGPTQRSTEPLLVRQSSASVRLAGHRLPHRRRCGLAWRSGPPQRHCLPAPEGEAASHGGTYPRTAPPGPSRARM